MTPEIMAARDEYYGLDKYHQDLIQEIADTPWWRPLYKHRLRRGRELVFKDMARAQSRLMVLIADHFKDQGDGIEGRVQRYFDGR